jgi:murein DD-endopeptidase MepM/ murein hydrolase activator NlpD
MRGRIAALSALIVICTVLAPSAYSLVSGGPLSATALVVQARLRIGDSVQQIDVEDWSRRRQAKHVPSFVQAQAVQTLTSAHAPSAVSHAGEGRAGNEAPSDAVHEDADHSEPAYDQATKSATPLPGHAITSLFGWRIYPIFHRRILHQGVDFSAQSGDQVHCVLDGVVTSARPHNGFGNVVYVFHPAANVTSMYAHLSQIDVHEGDNVSRGQVVGLAGATGYATGVHLHFGVLSGGDWVDPIAFLKAIPAIVREEKDGTLAQGHEQSPVTALPRG